MDRGSKKFGIIHKQVFTKAYRQSANNKPLFVSVHLVVNSSVTN